MKKMIIAVAAMLIMAATAGAQDATFQTKVYKDNGGDRLCVNSGGSITVYSGGDLDLKSGASLYYNATKILGSTTYLPVASGGTGSNTAAGARTTLSAAASGANSDITSITGLTTYLAVDQGGSGTNTAAGAASALGVGTEDSPAFTGLTLTNPLGVSYGGSGSNTAAGARDNLGFDFATASVTGTATIATTLSAVSICVASLDAISATEAYVQAVPSGGGVAVSVYGTDTTTLSSAAVNVHIFAGGTP